MSRLDLKDFLTVQEVAALLQLSVLTIYKYIRNGKLEAIAIGRHYRVSKSSLELFLTSHTVGGSHHE
jgi:excisionase family DNA binding protein